MKIYSRISKALFIAFWTGLIISFTGCKEDPDLPTLTTVDLTEISVNSAKTGGNITSDGGADILARGICWGLSSQPSIVDPHTSDGNGIGSFVTTLKGLTASTKYYVRAYATNKSGTAYGNEVTFTTTSPTVPTVSTVGMSAVTSSTAISGGNISSDGGSPVTARGICWATTSNPSTNDNTTSNGNGSGSYASEITGLQPGVTYYVRAYAENNIGIGYGNEISFTTLAALPTVTTANISSFTQLTAVGGGNVTSTGGATVTAKGVCWGTAPEPVAGGSHTTDGSGLGPFTSNITGLTPNTTYYVRAYATNSTGTSYGNQVSFQTTSVSAPSLTTNNVTNIGLSSAVSGGNVTMDNGGTVSERGICYNTTGNPTTGNSTVPGGSGTGTFSVNITGLSQGTVYYVRAYAINSAGISYGNQMRFSTSVSDINNNIYSTVIIGNQIWMRSDLKATIYNDNSSSIPIVTDPAVWITTTAPAYCWFDNASSNSSTYGILYNWYAVETGRICPTGWHVPTDTEFETMEMSLGMSSGEVDLTTWRGTDEGSQMKSATQWNGTNASGFSAIPGGYRRADTGNFYGLGILTYWWTASEYSGAEATYRLLDTENSGIFKNATSKRGGKFIRCVKNIL
jgi:uncharacterized protein (TIGR02145 family)